MRPIWCVLLWAGLCFSVQAQLDLDIGAPMPPLVVEMISSVQAVVTDCHDDFEFEGFEYVCAQFNRIYDANSIRGRIDFGIETPFLQGLLPAVRDGNTAELMEARPVIIQPWTENESSVVKGVRAGNTEIWVAVLNGTYEGRGLLVFLWREVSQ